VNVVRKSLFESRSLEIGTIEVRPRSDQCGDVERQDRHAMVLPIGGIFARHDAPGRQVTGTASHAVLVAADTPYRISFPGAIGDRALILRFGNDVALDRIDRCGSNDRAAHGLLPANAMMLRNLLFRRLARTEANAFEAEALGLDLLDLSLGAMRSVDFPAQGAAKGRRLRALERVKEAIAVAPSADWSVAKLASVANFSPFHLGHVFREAAGISIYHHVLRERLALALDAVLDGGDITAIALDTGFASHSHFTAHFRKFFGCTPTELRRLATHAQITELRKIATARRQASCLG
jgi:AraC family transcriptional regulator